MERARNKSVAAAEQIRIKRAEICSPGVIFYGGATDEQTRRLFDGFDSEGCPITHQSIHIQIVVFGTFNAKVPSTK